MPSRRQLLFAVGAGLGVGVGGGYAAGARPFAAESQPPPAPLAFAPTEWPFRDYDRGRTRSPPPESAPTGSLEEQWRHTSPRSAQAAPVVGNGEVVVPVSLGDYDLVELRSLDLASGAHTWTWDTPTPLSGDPSVLAVGNSVFAAVRLRDGPATINLAAASGAEQWQRVGGDNRSTLAPFTAAGYLVSIRWDDDPGIDGVDPQTGDIAWEWASDERPRHPVYDGERIIVRADDRLVALDPHTGDQRWESPVLFPQSPDVSGVVWGPVVAGGRIFVADTVGKLAAYDAETGDRLWQKRPTGPVDGPSGDAARWFGHGAVTDDAIATVEKRHDDAPDVLHIRDPTDGSLRWTAEPTEDGDAEFTAPVICDGTVYVGEQGDSTATGGVAGFDLASGERTLDHSLDGYVWNLVVTDGWVLAQTFEALVALQ